MAHKVTNKEIYKKNIKIQKTTATSLMTLTSSWENVTGSQISYTPEAGSNYVVYEFVTQMSYKANNNNAWFQLQYGNDISSVGNITTNNVGYINAFGGNNNSNSSFSTQVKLFYMIPAWSGEKVLVLQSRSSSSSYESYLNGLNSTVSFTNSTDYFNPFVEIYSI